MIQKILAPMGLVLAAALLLPAGAFADTAGWEYTTTGTEFTNGNWTMGEVFTASQSFDVTFLGYYNPSNGMNDSHWVGLYDSAGDLLASTTITSSSAFDTAHFLYNSIAPVQLTAGDTYVVEGVTGSDPYAFNDTGFTTYAPITILGNNWVLGGAQTFNGTGLINDVTDGFWGPDFGFDPSTVTPEPGSLMLFGSGMVLLAGVWRRKISARR